MKTSRIKLKPALFFFLCIYLITFQSYGQSPEVKFLIDTAITIMKQNSVNRDKVNWEKIRSKAFAQAIDKKNAYELGATFRMLFESVNDFHGAFFCWDSTYRWHRKEPEMPDSIKKEWNKGVFIQTNIINGNIGYLRVPYISFAERSKMDKNSQDLNDSLCSLLDKNVAGIILDLRLNGGGAMYPMMLGLEQLLQEGKLGSFATKDPSSWIIKNNGFYLDSNILTSIQPKCDLKSKNIRVAVLIGPGTGSSGEFLAISFKKRKRTIFIGSTTAGYITVTRGFKINDAVSMLLSVGYGKDREGQIYDQAIEPDIYIKTPDSFNDIKHDRKVIAAAKWIGSQKD